MKVEYIEDAKYICFFKERSKYKVIAIYTILHEIVKVSKIFIF